MVTDFKILILKIVYFYKCVLPLSPTKITGGKESTKGCNIPTGLSGWSDYVP